MFNRIVPALIWIITMKITILNYGKTDNRNLELLISDYLKRIKRYIPVDYVFINPPKQIYKYAPEEIKIAEGEYFQKRFASFDYLVLLDERGKQYRSVSFASHLQDLMNIGYKNICFLTGGAYGFSKSVYQLADDELSMSLMTTTHQIIRLIFIEQLYRAFTIINHHPYHNE